MRVIIIEDEKPAAEKLKRLIFQYDANIEIIKILTSVKHSTKWFTENPDSIDLVFADIQLQDGLSLEIFTQVIINKPVIFTTAFNEYAIEAFKHNSIDYILKPIKFEALKKSMEKLKTIGSILPGNKNSTEIPELQQLLSKIQKNYKTRFMVKVGEHIKSITTDKIAMFYAEGRTVFLFTKSGRKFIIDYKLEDLEEILAPEDFFRVSRSFIVNIEAIKDVIVFSGTRFKIDLIVDFDKDIIVSRDKSPMFKIWFNGME